MSVPQFIHPPDTQAVMRASLVYVAFGIGMLTDTALAGGALILGRVLREFPLLRICLSRGGGALSWISACLRFGRAQSKPGSESIVDEVATRLYVDSLVFDPRQLCPLASRFGVGHVLAGSDYPSLPNGPAPQSVVDEPSN